MGGGPEFRYPTTKPRRQHAVTIPAERELHPAPTRRRTSHATILSCDSLTCIISFLLCILIGTQKDQDEADDAARHKAMKVNPILLERETQIEVPVGPCAIMDGPTAADQCHRVF